MEDYQVFVQCGRCLKVVDGLQTPEATSGFYKRLSNPKPGEWDWGQFMSETEQILCDDCMQHDPRYEAIYGKQY